MRNIINPVSVKGNKIFINRRLLRLYRWLFNVEIIENNFVVQFNEKKPSLIIYEDGQRIVKYDIEPLNSNPNLTDQYFHISIWITKDNIFQMDGLIYKDKILPDESSIQESEGIRFQPVFLSDTKLEYKDFIGKGLFDRGLHYSGRVTPGNVRSVCLCDNCMQSFSIKSFHSGFSDVHYFYSEDGIQTLIVSAWDFEGLSGIYQTEVDREKIKQVESQLPIPTVGTGRYKYYNSFRCPHCKKPYIDFERYPEKRPGEYYGNVHINQEIQSYSKRGLI